LHDVLALHGGDGKVLLGEAGGRQALSLNGTEMEKMMVLKRADSDQSSISP
jgi:hypothetical protein